MSEYKTDAEKMRDFINESRGIVTEKKKKGGEIEDYYFAHHRLTPVIDPLRQIVFNKMENLKKPVKNVNDPKLNKMMLKASKSLTAAMDAFDDIEAYLEEMIEKLEEELY